MSLNDSLSVEQERAWQLFFAASGSEQWQGVLKMNRTEALIELKRDFPHLWIQLTLKTSTGENNVTATI